MRETVERATSRRKKAAGDDAEGARPRRRWLRWVGAVVAALLAFVVAVYMWAWASVDSSTMARAIWWMGADVGDQYRFPARTIPAGNSASALPNGPEIDLSKLLGRTAGTFDATLEDSGTLAFLVVHDDRLVYERYFAGSDRRSRQTSFSVAKSVLSTLVGIAIEEGLIGGVSDPVTRYLPELAERDPRFDRITLRDLLTMSSGLRYEEQSIPFLPWGDDINTYYGVDLRDLALTDTHIESPPRQEWLYNNYNPLLLGMVLERAADMSVSRYMSTRLWRPLGAEADATWSLDSDRAPFEKMESGLNAAPVDYARFGLLFLHGGKWNGPRIVSKDWVRAATAADTTTDPATDYQYFWWVDVERPGRFYALGNFGQYIYVAPDTGTVVVRLGRDWGLSDHTWVALFREIADQLSRRS